MSDSPTAPDNRAAYVMLAERLSFLQTLPPEDLYYILGRATDFITIFPRQEIYKQGAEVDYVYYVVEGEVEQARTEETSGGKRQSLRRRVEADNLLGHFDLLYNQSHSTTARATSFGQIIRVEAQALNRLLYRFPGLRMELAPLDRVARLRTIPFFADCDLITLSFLAEAAGKVREVARDDYIFRDETNASHLYLIDSGQVVLESGNGQTWLGTGAAFGYGSQKEGQHTGNLSSVAFDAPTSARACCNTRYFELPRRAVRNITNIDLEARGATLRETMLKTLHDLVVFDNFDEQQLDTLAGFASHFYIPSHHLIIPQGEVADSLWVLMEGSRATLHAVDDSEHALPRTPISGPSFFSETALLSVSQPISSSVEAEPDSHWLRLHEADFRRFLKQEGEELAQKLVIQEETRKQLLDSEEQRYGWLEQGEVMDKYQRRHWIVLLRKIWLPTLLLVGGPFLALAGLAALPSTLPALLVGLPSVLIWLIVLAYFAWSVVDYLNDFLLVTSRRIVRQERVVFFSEWQQVAPLEQVQSVNTSRSFIGNLLGFGNVQIQTASQQGSITFDYVPEPEAIRKAIFEQMRRLATVTRAQSKMLIHEMLENRLGLALQIPGRLCTSTKQPQPEATEDGSLRSRVRQALDLERHLVLSSDKGHIIWRKHWILLLQNVALPLLLTTVAALSALLLPLGFSGVGNWVALELPAVLFSLLGLAWVAWIVADWRNDTYEVTDSLIIDIQKKPLFFSEERREARLEDIEDILLNIPSPLHYFLDFGNVKLQTAAAQGSLTFDAVPHPRQVAEEIRRRISAVRQREEQNRQRRRNSEMPDWFEMYDRMDKGSQNRVNHGLVKDKW